MEYDDNYKRAVRRTDAVLCVAKGDFMNVQKVVEDLIAEFGESKVRMMINDLDVNKDLEVKMDFNTVGELMMVVYDELKDDNNSKDIINELDCADNDKTIRENFNKAVMRLREIGKDDVANLIEQRLK